MKSKIVKKKKNEKLKNLKKEKEKLEWSATPSRHF
jgi:hypothetical protein